MASWKTTQRVGQNPAIINALTHGLSFATDAEINEVILRRYRLYDYLTPSDTANSMMLQSVIDAWKDYTEKLYQTTIYEYDPILNYDKHIEGTIIDAHHKGTKTATNTDIKTGQNTDLTVGTEMDRKSARNTDFESTETPTTKETTTNTGYGFDSAAAGAPIGKSEHQYNSGNTKTVDKGLEANNYTRDTAAEEDNFQHTTADEEDNFQHTAGTAANNYVTVTDIDEDTFDKDEKSFAEYREYGNIGVMTTADIIAKERSIIVDVLDVYVSKFADCFDLSSKILYGWLEDEEDDE